MDNLNFHSTVKLNSRETCSNTGTAKFNVAKMQKFRGSEKPAKISDNKV